MNTITKLLTSLVLFSAIAGLIYFIFFGEVNNSNMNMTDTQKITSTTQETTSTNNSIPVEETTNTATAKTTTPQKQTVIPQYKDVFKDDMKTESSLKKMNENKRVEEIDKKVALILKEAQEVVTKNNLTLPKEKIDPVKQKEFEERKEKLRKELEAIQNKINK